MKRIHEVKNKKPLRENLQHVLPEMLDDIMMFRHRVVTHPMAKDTLHQMRIAGKPLRYAMEIGEIAFSDDFRKCLIDVKDTVELMGEIHDADVMIPEIEHQIREIRLFNSTLGAYKERISTRGLRTIAAELKQKRRRMYDELCNKLNEWEKKNFRSKLIKAMQGVKTSTRQRVLTALSRSEKAGMVKKYPAIIQSKLLSGIPGLVHGMSTKLGKINEPPFYNNLSSRIGDKPENVAANRAHFLGTLGIIENELAVPHQIHSDNIRIIDKPGFYNDTDGLITAAKNVFLVVSTADCFPVLIYDKSKLICAAIHSGWRGTQKNITGKAIEMMKNELGCDTKDFLVFIGPGISKKHFEVGEDVAALFDAKFVEQRKEKFYVNIAASVLEQIKSHGITEKQIEFSPKCTYAEINYLHSYRRDKEKSGRMFSVIGMKEVD